MLQELSCGVSSLVAGSAAWYNYATAASRNAGRIVHKSPEVMAQDFFLYRRNQFRFPHSTTFSTAPSTA